MSRSKTVIAVNLQTGEETIHENTYQAAQALGISNSTIWLICHGRQEQSRGYTFRYAETIEEGELSMADAEIIVAMADSGLSQIGAARKVYKCHHTVYYHCRAIKEKTGLDPKDFYDMCELLPMAKAVLEEEHEHQG